LLKNEVDNIMKGILFFVLLFFGMVCTVVAQDTITKTKTVKHVKEQEIILGFDFGVKYSPYDYYLQSDSNSLNLQSFSYNAYGGVFLNGFSLYTGIGFKQFNKSHKSNITTFKETYTVNYTAIDTIDVFNVYKDGVLEERVITSEREATRNDTLWETTTILEPERLNCFVVPIQLYYLYPINKFDVFYSIGGNIHIPTSMYNKVKPFVLFNTELGARYYISDNFGCELMVNLQKGKINSKDYSIWGNTHFLSSGMSISFAYYL